MKPEEIGEMLGYLSRLVQAPEPLAIAGYGRGQEASM
jgi:hypothetical protein